jgi:methionyl-tRNA synthetase
MREISFGQDGSFSWESMLARYNSDLANDYGNLASRVLSMVGRYLDGEVPKPPSEDELREEDHRLIKAQRDAWTHMVRSIDLITPTQACKAAWSFVRKANGYVEEVAPWKLAKDEAERRRLEVVLYLLSDSLRLLALMTSPIIPRAAQALWEKLALEGNVEDLKYADHGEWFGLPAGNHVSAGAPLFPRIEEEAAV